MNFLERVTSLVRGEPSWGKLERSLADGDAFMESVREPVMGESTSMSTASSGIITRSSGSMSSSAPQAQHSIGAALLDVVGAGSGSSHLSDNLSEVSLHRATRDGFNKASVVRKCVDIISDNVASVPLVVRRRRKSDGKYVPAKGTQAELLQKLLDKPSPELSGFDLRERITQHNLLNGNGLFKKIRASDGRPRELALMNPDGIVPRTKRIAEGRIVLSHYNRREHFSTHRIHEQLKPKDVGHMMLANPCNPFWGSSLLMSLALVVDSDNEGLANQRTISGSAGRPGGVIEYEEPLDNEAYQEARKRLNEATQGANSEGRFLIVDDGGVIKQFSFSPRELQYLEAHVRYLEDILSAYSVPPPVAGYYDKSNYSTAHQARAIFLLTTVSTHVNRLCAMLTRHLAHDFDEHFVIVPDYSSVPGMQDVFRERLIIALQLKKLGYPLDMINERLELDMPMVGLPKVQ